MNLKSIMLLGILSATSFCAIGEDEMKLSTHVSEEVSNCEDCHIPLDFDTSISHNAGNEPLNSNDYASGTNIPPFNSTRNVQWTGFGR